MSRPSPRQHATVLERLGMVFAQIAGRYLPDPLVLACLLTLVVAVVAYLFPQSRDIQDLSWTNRAGALSRMWLGAVWNPRFLTFALQMCLVLLTGFGLARAPLALRALRSLAALPRSNRGAVMLIAAVSCAGCWINWGFGLILAGVLAGELRRSLALRGVRCQYALIVAAAYCGMMIWHGGFSGSATLKVASEGVTLEVADAGEMHAETVPPIAISRTILHPTNLVLTVVLIISVPLILARMGKRHVEVDDHEADSAVSHAAAHVRTPRDARTPADWLNESRALSIAIALLLIAGVYAAAVHGEHGNASPFTAVLRTLNLDTVNSLFLAAGLLLHPNLRSYIAAVTEGGHAIVGIVMQFPLYAGIQGLMFGAGLAVAVSEGFVGLSRVLSQSAGLPVGGTFPVATFASASIVNFFVPSGGGQWIVQGPIMCSAGHALGLPIEQTVMAIAYGDQLTNMVQPFWAIPLMGMTRVDARQFMGYCALLMLLAAPVFAVALICY